MTTRAKLHTAWSSVLIDSTITGALTISRNGVVVAAVPAGQLVWYDHFPPLGVSLTYSVTNGTTTETAVITVPARADHKTWLKSGADPNLSIALIQRPLEPVAYSPRAGVYYPVATTPGVQAVPFVTYGGLTAARTMATFKAESAAERDQLVQLVAAGPVYYQPCPDLSERARWCAAVDRDIGEQRAHVPVQWDMTVPLTETAAPTFDTSRQVIPGWSWTDVAATYATWTATAAARTTWVDLVRFGVT